MDEIEGKDLMIWLTTGCPIKGYGRCYSRRTLQEGDCSGTSYKKSSTIIVDLRILI